MRIPVTDVPIELRRLAARHLESLRDSELAAGIGDAYLDDFAVPIYRLDMKDPAYYEFTVVRSGKSLDGVLVLKTSCFVEKPQTKRSKAANKVRPGSEQTLNSAAIGFIVVSNGTHDFPVAHWSLNRLPPSHQVLIRRAEDGKEEPIDATPARLYKLDALAYVAESEQGELIGNTGQMPGLIVGLPFSLEKYAGQISSVTAYPLKAQQTDSNGQRAEHEVRRSEYERPDLKLNDEGGWKAYKERYHDSFGPLLEHLRNRAARTWELEDLIRKFGEGIMTGTTHRVALLSEAAIELRGPGAQYVRPRIVENAAGPPSLLLQAADVQLQQEADLDVVIKYSDGQSERLQFFVVSGSVPSNTKAERSRQRQSLEVES